ncbi:hypothetical protein [Dyadobacter sp. NIV53]|uniref:hypothetical protein n=1 Tax=Dyadobacter sp. NIV53 TaxID=2861765 RepID=UPI001C887648|nr:hypothetical protein [Dyadobacter sp. NIV53]
MANQKKINDQNGAGLEDAHGVAMEYNMRAEEAAEARENAEQQELAAVEHEIEHANEREV